MTDAKLKLEGWIEKVEETFDSQSDIAPLSSKDIKRILKNSGVNYRLPRRTQALKIRIFVTYFDIW